MFSYEKFIHPLLIKEGSMIVVKNTNSPPFKEEYPKGEVVELNHPE